MKEDWTKHSLTQVYRKVVGKYLSRAGKVITKEDRKMEMSAS